MLSGIAPSSLSRRAVCLPARNSSRPAVPTLLRRLRSVRRLAAGERLPPKRGCERGLRVIEGRQLGVGSRLQSRPAFSFLGDHAEKKASRKYRPLTIGSGRRRSLPTPFRLARV